MNWFSLDFEEKIILIAFILALINLLAVIGTA
jgi:hypothetical protein